MANEQVTKDFQDRADAAAAKASKAMEEFVDAQNRFKKEGSTIINKATQEDIDNLKQAAAKAREQALLEADRLKKWKEKNG